MFGVKILKPAVVITLVLFCFLIGTANYSFAAQEDDLTKARKLYQEGDYEGSITLLSGFIEKLKAMVEQKKSVAEAFYLLAKIYYEVGDEPKVDENLNKVFETYPTFTKDESNFGFKERVEKARKAFMAAREAEETKKTTVETEEFEEPVKKEEVKPQERKVIEQTKAKKKKKKFPTLLVVGGVILVGVLAALLLKKKKSEESRNDIRGTWAFDVTDSFGDRSQFNLRFSGSETSGSVYNPGGDYLGDYTVSGSSVTFDATVYYDDGTTATFDFWGNFSTRDIMGGNGEITFSDLPNVAVGFTWTSSRLTTPGISSVKAQALDNINNLRDIADRGKKQQ